jgi:thiosulfate/3-mercaptopyruvate sulfurtransferase
MSAHRQISILLALGAALLLTQGCANSPGPAAGPAGARPMESLVTAEWLHKHLSEPDLVVLDATVLVKATGDGNIEVLNGRPSYDAGHIPGAAFADLMGELSDSDSPWGFAAPAPEAFAAAMSRLGVGDDTRVVIYDAMNSAWAARVWWMLRWIGFDNAALLDGGLQAWKAAGYPVSTESPSPPQRTLTLNVRPALFADRDEVRAAVDDDAVHLIDAMTEVHYRGDWAMYARPGHITGAMNVPSTSLMTETGHFRPKDELSALIATPRSERTITYCGGGIAAAADAFVLIRLGFTDVAVYDHSLQEWTADPANPMATATEFDEL